MAPHTPAGRRLFSKVVPRRRARWHMAHLLACVALLAAACGGPPAPTTPSASGPSPTSSSAASTSSAASRSAATTSSGSASAGSGAAGGAVKEVLIGELLSLTGTFASSAPELKGGVETAVEVINNKHPGITLPLGQGQGLPGLGGAKIKPVFRDDQSKGELSRTIAEQLITQDRVMWLNCCSTSGLASIVQPVAESHQLPMSCNSCSSPSLTEKGFKYFWRVGPNDTSMVGNEFTFLKEWPQHGGPELKTLAQIACDNIFCQDGRKIVNDLAPKAGLQVVLDLTVKEESPTLASEVQRLRAANPDVLFATLYQSSTTVLLNSMKQSGWMPKVYMTNDGAYSFTTWLDEAKKANASVGFLGRDPTAIDFASKNPNWVAVNEVYKTFSGGKDMGELAMREFTGFMWIADVFNRAGSTDPAALQKAAAATDLSGDQFIIDYKGIKFDDNHQNTLASGVVTQIGWDGNKHTVWPWEQAARGDYQIIVPMPSWQDRANRPPPTK